MDEKEEGIKILEIKDPPASPDLKKKTKKDKKLILALFLLIVFIGITIFVVVIIFSPDESDKYEIGNNIQSILISPKGNELYINVYPQDKRDEILKATYEIYSKGVKYTYDDVGGVSDIKNPYGPSFFNWLIGKKYPDYYDFKVTLSNFKDLNNFRDMESLTISLTYDGAKSETVEENSSAVNSDGNVIPNCSDINLTGSGGGAVGSLCIETNSTEENKEEVGIINIELNSTGNESLDVNESIKNNSSINE